MRQFATSAAWLAQNWSGVVFGVHSGTDSHEKNDYRLLDLSAGAVHYLFHSIAADGIVSRIRKTNAVDWLRFCENSPAGGR